jgi:hypothetical protein
MVVDDQAARIAVGFIRRQHSHGGLGRARSSPHDQFLIGLAEAYNLRLSQPTIRGVAIPLSMKCQVIGDPMLSKKEDINAGE